MIRVPTRRVFRVDEIPVERDLKRATARIDELHFDVVVPCFQGIRQTDGLGTVVSDDAVFDRDVHRTVLSGMDAVYQGLTPSRAATWPRKSAMYKGGL